MRRLRYNAAISLDGYIASSDGSTSWIVEDLGIDFESLYGEFDTFVMGRKTYEEMTSLDPNPLTDQPKSNVVVVSRQMTEKENPNITIFSEGFVDYIKKQKAEEGKDLWLMGGGQLVSSLLEAGVVDLVELAVMPVVLGEGIKMISEPPTAAGSGSDARHEAKPYKLELQESRVLAKSGIVMVKYKVLYAQQ